MIYLILFIIFLVLTILLGFTSWNMLRKNEKQEDILSGYFEYLDKISKIIELSDKKLKQVDRSGAFANDDEVGEIFKSIKSIQDILNDFQIKNLK